jgi:cytidylate kinase
MLGYRYFDKELMAEVAHEVGLSPQEIVDFPEDEHRVNSFLGRVLRRPQTVSQTRTWTEDKDGSRTMEVVQLDARQSISMVRSLIHAAVKLDDVVVVGRGGQAVLMGEPRTLHVRIQAPLDQRVRRVRQREGLTDEAAQALIAERDRAAADYLRTFYHVDWADPRLYHLVLNTGLWSIATTAQVIVDALKYVAPGKGPEEGQN